VGVCVCGFLMCVCMCGFCNAWVCMCGFCNAWVCVCVFLIHLLNCMLHYCGVIVHALIHFMFFSLLAYLHLITF